MSYEWGAPPPFEVLEARRLQGTNKVFGDPVAGLPATTSTTIAPTLPPAPPVPPPPSISSATTTTTTSTLTTTNSFATKLGLVKPSEKNTSTSSSSSSSSSSSLSVPLAPGVKIIASGSVAVSSLSKDERLKRTIWANESQTSNPLLPFIRHVIIDSRKGLEADFIVTKSCCVFFLSLKYHALKPKLMKEKINAFEKSGLAFPFKLRVLLLWVDVLQDDKSMSDLSVFAIEHNLTIMCAFSLEECARYLETMKTYESKSAASIMAKRETEYLPIAQEALTEIKSVNKLDVQRLLHHFGSVSEVMTAKEDELLEPIGIGELKAHYLFSAFNEPFLGRKTTVAVAIEKGTKKRTMLDEDQERDKAMIINDVDDD